MRYRTFRIILPCLFIITMLSGYTNVLSEQNRTWSFEFANLAISDALSEISHESGIDILLKGESTEISITKSYKHFTLDEVLMDMFRDQSFMALFNYNDQILSSINIWIMPKADGMIENANNINATPDKYNINRKSYNNQGQIRKIEYTPDLSRSINNIKADSNKTVHNNKSISSSPIRQSSGSTNKYGGLNPDNKDKFSDQEEIIDADDNPDNDSPSDQKQFGGLEPPPMPPGMIRAEE